MDVILRHNNWINGIDLTLKITNKWKINRVMNNRIKFLFTLLVAGLLLQGCSPRKFYRGYMADARLINAIRPNIDNEESVTAMLGSPSTKATFDSLSWYYYAKQSEQTAFFKEKITKLQIVAVRFNEKGYVEKVDRYNMDNYNNISPVGDKTVTYGRETHFFKELFGNIGQFGAGGVPQAGN